MKKILDFLAKYQVAIVVVVAILAACGVIAPAFAAVPLFAGVTTTDLTKGSSYPAAKTSKVINIRQRITIPLALQVASDVLKLVNVKAGWFIQQVAIQMVTPSTGTALTANIGDGDNTSGFDAAMSLKGAAGTVTQGAPGTDAFLTAGGKLYTVDDTIDAVFATVTAPAGAVVCDVIVIGLDTNK